jgi:hypothetical protein
MSRCRSRKKVFLESLYGELGPAGENKLRRHLEKCPACSREYDDMAATLVVLSRPRTEDPGADFWDGYYDRLERRMSREGAFEASRREPSPAPRARFGFAPRWAFGAAGAVGLLAAGILIGRLTIGRVPVAGPSLGGPSALGGTAVLPAAQSADLSVRTSRYLERSKVILLALVNFDAQKKDVYGLNLPRQKEMSRELVNEASILRGDLKAAKERRLERLVGELEMILIQLANLKNEVDLPSIEIIKAGAELKDILFKINLSEMRRESDKTRLPVAPAPKDKKI